MIQESGYETGREGEGVSRRSTRRRRKRLSEMQEGLCGLCWLPLHGSLSTDHILPRTWHDKLDKPGKHRWDNLQVAHVACDNRKGSYPSPWNRHTLRMTLATIREDDGLDTDSRLWKLVGDKPIPQNNPIVQGPEWDYPSTAFGLIVPYIHKYFTDQGLRVPRKIRRDQFLQQFEEWMEIEPMSTWFHNELALLATDAPEMWNRAVEHVMRLELPGYLRGELRMRPGFKVPTDAKGPPVGIRKVMDDEVVLEGFLWPTSDPLRFVVSKRRDDKPEGAIDEWCRHG